MKYQIIKLDGRFSYRDRFEYAIKFNNTMSAGHGPLIFNNALRWFFDTYGWSAEIRDYVKMQRWTSQTTQLMGNMNLAQGLLPKLPDHCNPHWSWTNGYPDSLRIYAATDRELVFFQLAHPLDQK